MCHFFHTGECCGHLCNAKQICLISLVYVIQLYVSLFSNQIRNLVCLFVLAIREKKTLSSLLHAGFV